MEVAAVNATLAFLDEYDVDPDDDDNMDSDRCSQATVVSRSSDAGGGEEVAMGSVKIAMKSARCNRVRPKEELTRLRKQESELSSKLRDLRLEARRQVVRTSRSSSTRKGTSGKLNGRRNSLLFWERAASRQLQHRQQSEQENRRLTGLLRAQIRHARQLQQAMNRQLNASVSARGYLYVGVVIWLTVLLVARVMLSL